MFPTFQRASPISVLRRSMEPISCGDMSHSRSTVADFSVKQGPVEWRSRRVTGWRLSRQTRIENVGSDVAALPLACQVTGWRSTHE